MSTPINRSYLLVWSCNLKDIQLKFDLTNIIVHPGYHEVAHGLGRGRVDEVGAVLHGVGTAHVLKVAADAKAGGAGALWTSSFGKTVLGSVTCAIVVFSRQAHLVLEPENKDKRILEKLN